MNKLSKLFKLSKKQPQTLMRKVLIACCCIVTSMVAVQASADYMQEKIDARVAELTRQFNNGDVAAAEEGYNALKGKYGHYASMKKLAKALLGDNFIEIAGGQCVKDTNTGLIWERKATSGLRDKDHTYTWYSTRNNGGDAGWKDKYDYYEIEGQLNSKRAPKYRGETCGGSLKACNTADYVAAVNKQGLCGYNDWRLPTKWELLSIVDKRKPGCAKGKARKATGGCVNRSAFPNTASDNGFYINYWSSSPYANDSNHAWLVYFFYGVENAYFKSRNFFVRLVRSGQ